MLEAAIRNSSVVKRKEVLCGSCRLLVYNMDGSGSAEGQETRKRSKAWTESEEVSHITLVLEKEELLFGELKGSWGKNIHRKRSEGWEEIAGQLNTRNIDAKREAAEVKKKFFNLKQRAKAKIDAIKSACHKTGGGPAPPQLNAADQALTQSLEGRPGIHGLDNAVDTDDMSLLTEISRGNSVTDYTEAGTSEQVPPQTSCEQERLQNVTSSSKKEKSFSKKRNQPEATYINTLMDTERIKLEKRKLQMEIDLLEKKQRKVETEIQLNNLRTVYYQLKISSEFGVNVEMSKNEQ